MSGIQTEYSTADLADLLQITERAVRKRAEKQQWNVIQRPERLGGNLYTYDGLPCDVKARLVTSTAQNLPESNRQVGDAVIPDWSHRIGNARYQVILAWRDYCRKQSKAKAKMKKIEATEAFLTAYNNGLVVQEAFEAIGQVKKSSLYRWEQILRENGDDYYSICDQRGSWAKGGPKGLGQLTEEAQEALLAAWLNPNQPSMTLAHRCMALALDKIGQEVPSMTTTVRFIKRFSETNYDLVVLMREGEKALNDKVANWIRRDRTCLKVGDTLFADGHVLNFECLHPITGQPFRPTMLLWFDWKSGLPVGWEFMPTENTISISSALRMAIRHLGMVPKSVYLDNGRAFKSKYFTQTDPNLEPLKGLYARLGIATQFATPYRGQVKIIERFFSTFNEQFAKLVPTYVGRNIDEKPAWRRRNEKFHKARHEKRDPGIPTLREAGLAFADYVNWFAENMTHPDLNQNTCGEIFLEGRGPGVELPDLDRHFLWSKEVQPTNGGFTLVGLRYVSDILYGLNHKVIAKYSWADLNVVYLYDAQGRSLGEAKTQEPIHPQARIFGTEHDMALVAEANRRNASQKKITLNKARALDKSLKDRPGVAELPYKPEVIRQEPKQLEAPPEPPISEEEKAYLEAVYEESQASKDEKKFNRPESFKSRLDRFNWLFTSWLDGYPLNDDDLDFMREYEASKEYKEITGARFEKLKAVYGRSPLGGAQCTVSLME